MAALTNTIHFKFRSATTFDTIPIPGTMARIFDVKRAIITKKKMGNRSGSSGIEFDLSVVNAQTGEEYADENKMIPRGTKVVVHRLPAARGMGLLTRIARAETGNNSALSTAATTFVPPAGHYDVKGRDKDEEFVDTAISFSASTEEDSKRKAQEEEDALQRAVSGRAGLYRASGRVWMNDSGTPNLLNGGSGASSFNTSKLKIGTSSAGGGDKHQGKYHGQGMGGQHFQKPNADPELRSLEPTTKKRATGIPRTFLNFIGNNENSAADDDKGVAGVMEAPGGGNATLQPNHQAFLSMLSRSGGKSNRGDLTLALSRLNKTLPEHFKCAICSNIVRDAVILRWDPEGRNVCDSCIRSALTAENGFHCPVTGIDGASPDDLIVNHGLRKAAAHFVGGIMSDLEELDKNAAEVLGTGGSQEDLTHAETPATNISKKRSRASIGDLNEGGLGDDFGGDVFDMCSDEEDAMNPEFTESNDNDKNDSNVSQLNNGELQGKNEIVKPIENESRNGSNGINPSGVNTENQSDVTFNNTKKPTVQTKVGTGLRSSVSPSQNVTSKVIPRVRGPPPGYASGPALPSAALSGAPPHNKGFNGRGRGYGPTHSDGMAAGRGVRDGQGRGGRGNRWHFPPNDHSINSHGGGRIGPHGGRGSMHPHSGVPGYHPGQYNDNTLPQLERNIHKEHASERRREGVMPAFNPIDRLEHERLSKRPIPNVVGNGSFDRNSHNQRFGPNGQNDSYYGRGSSNSRRPPPPPHHYGPGPSPFQGRGPPRGSGRGFRGERRPF